MLTCAQRFIISLCYFYLPLIALMHLQSFVPISQSAIPLHSIASAKSTLYYNKRTDNTYFPSDGVHVFLT